MASSYALPATGFPHHHPHSGHGHSHTHTPPSLGSLSPPRSLKSEPRSNGEARPSVHENHHHSHHRANTSQPMQHRPHIPPPLAPSGAAWNVGSTAGGKAIITPTNTSFDPSSRYEAPTQSHSHSRRHEHSAERSTFTALLLPYTSRWPLLHAIMTEKDSRRIFYFMR